MFQIKVLENIKTHILCSVSLFRKSCRLWDNVENMVEPQKTPTIFRMRVACRITKATRAQAHTDTRAPTPTRTRTHAHACVTYRPCAALNGLFLSTSFTIRWHSVGKSFSTFGFFSMHDTWRMLVFPHVVYSIPNFTYAVLKVHHGRIHDV